MNKERQQKAANDLAELEASLKEIVVLLRQGQADEKAHALLYVLRRRIGYIVRDLAVVENQPSTANIEYAENIIDSQIWLHQGDRS